MRTAKLIHASSRRQVNWTSINWKKAKQRVQELQVRIAKAIREGKFRLVRSLQWLLTHSFYGKLLAIKRVVANQGKTTPGVDGVVWNTPRKKMQVVNLLNRRGYRPLPLRRVYNRKKNGKLRPLSIPTMRDRAMQALQALSLVPVAERLGRLYAEVAFEGLELSDGKLSRSALRGLGAGNSPRLPGLFHS